MKNSYYKDLFSSLLRKRSFWFPIIILLLLMIVGFIIDITKYDELIKINFDNQFIKPNNQFIFGTNEYGQDLFYLVFVAAFNSIKLSFIVIIANCLLGCIIGLIWGSNPKIDSFMLVIKNVFDNIPMTFVYVIVISSLGNDFIHMLFVVVLFGWINIACLVRNNLIITRSKDYNTMSKLLKTSKLKVAIHNYLPSLLPVIFNSIALSFPSIISLEITLSYFGFSFSNTNVSLGTLLYNSLSTSSCFTHPYLFLIPFTIILIINMCCFYIGKTISSISNKEENQNA